MDTTEFYETILSISDPWEVEGTQTYASKGYVDVRLSHSEIYTCPQCAHLCTRHDSKERRWRHLDSCGYQTFIIAAVPRVRCPEHGVQQVPIPWDDGRAPYIRSLIYSVC